MQESGLRPAWGCGVNTVAVRIDAAAGAGKRPGNDARCIEIITVADLPFLETAGNRRQRTGAATGTSCTSSRNAVRSSLLTPLKLTVCSPAVKYRAGVLPRTQVAEFVAATDCTPVPSMMTTNDCGLKLKRLVARNETIYQPATSKNRTIKFLDRLVLLAALVLSMPGTSDRSVCARLGPAGPLHIAADQ